MAKPAKPSKPATSAQIRKINEARRQTDIVHQNFNRERQAERNAARKSR